MIRFTLNGTERVYAGDPRTALIDVLREGFALTGAKPVCGEGFCGACTVLVGGAPMASCLIAAGTLEGAAITTIEGASPPEALNPVQQAFVDHDVVQCGMCFPGMVMVLTHFLEACPSPSRDEVKSALTGNICRCTGYERIVDAVMALSEGAQKGAA